MGDFYTKAAATAQRMIEKYGRTVTLVSRSAVPTDVTKPWRGDTAGDAVKTDVIAVEEQSTVENTPASLLGRVRALYLVAFGTAGVDLLGYSQLIDNGQVYEIEKIDALSPGPSTLMYSFYVK